MCSPRKWVLPLHNFGSLHVEALCWAACAGDIYSLQLKLKAEPRGRNFRCCLGMSSHHKGIYHAVIQNIFSAVEYNPRRMLFTHQRRMLWSTTIDPCWSSHHCWNFLPVMPCSQRTWRKIWVKGMHFCLQSDSWSHRSWPATGVQRPGAEHARIHTRTTREEDYRERGNLRALSGVEDFLRITAGSSKPSSLVSWRTVSHSQYLCRNSFFLSFLCQIAFMWYTSYA